MVVTGIVIAFITVANLFSAARLIADILTNNKIFANSISGCLLGTYSAVRECHRGGSVWF